MSCDVSDLPEGLLRDGVNGNTHEHTLVFDSDRGEEDCCTSEIRAPGPPDRPVSALPDSVKVCSRDRVEFEV